jgi:hypothetical protein
VFQFGLKTRPIIALALEEKFHPKTRRTNKDEGEKITKWSIPICPWLV